MRMIIGVDERNEVPRYIRQSWQRPPNKRLMPEKGDYVLATKYYDGDPGDHFCIGYYDGCFQNGRETRYIVVDDKGQCFRANGFRRVAKISSRRGTWMVQHFALIKQMKNRYSVWHWFIAPWAELDAIDSTPSP